MKVVDLGSQMSALFEQEEMLAFFDVSLLLPGRDPIEALGRLSKPKTSAAGNSYLSMFILVDTPDEDLRAEVEAYFKAVSWARWREQFDGVVEVVPMPPMHASPELYIAAVDIVTKSDAVNDELGGRRLLATLDGVIPARMGEITSWEVGEDDAGEQSKSAWELFKERLLGSR